MLLKFFHPCFLYFSIILQETLPFTCSIPARTLIELNFVLLDFEKMHGDCIFDIGYQYCREAESSSERRSLERRRWHKCWRNWRNWRNTFIQGRERTRDVLAGLGDSKQRHSGMLPAFSVLFWVSIYFCSTTLPSSLHPEDNMGTQPFWPPTQPLVIKAVNRSSIEH